MTTFQVTLPFPPSVNTITACVRNRKITSKKGREYREAAMVDIAAHGLTLARLAGSLEVSLDLHPPDNRRRDIDNYSKAVLDALTEAGVWHDDEQIDRLHILKCPRDKNNPRVVVTISQIG